jgi:hypothetical protein
MGAFINIASLKAIVRIQFVRKCHGFEIDPIPTLIIHNISFIPEVAWLGITFTACPEGQVTSLGKD